MSSAPPRAVVPRLNELKLEIETARLRLRPMAEADAEAMWPIVSQPDFPKQMSWAAHKHRDETVDFIKSQCAALEKNDTVNWVILHDGKLVGSIELGSIEWQVAALRVDRAELGYWLAPPLWGKGMMTEAVNAVVRFGFEQIGLHKITTRCFVDNTASRRVIEKVGFRFVGRAEEDIWREGRWITHLLYELTSPEWPDVHTTMPISRPRPT